MQILNVGFTKSNIPEIAEEFLKGNKEKRTALIKKLASGDDEEERREHRDEAIAILNGVEVAILRPDSAKATTGKQGVEVNAKILSEILILRGYLHDTSAPVKMILEHLSLVLPKGLL